MKKPEKCENKIISMNWQELATMLRRNEKYIDLIEEKLEEAYTDGFNDSKYDFDIENYIEI